ncbi:hypothetical protein OGAPHI_006055 [Ogataea philodendri]|uniref:Uncharacterized protein n=2 Tax=Saccharomycotina TaxID=147537 RepID=A0A9P8T0V5_9ASCO|nr:uncharacterized protein OGAPHI_006055 [Ogataea philodendri]KAH3661876.1 hypothetical protein OGAPHI_006055 [Ogataea philodendri]
MDRQLPLPGYRDYQRPYGSADDASNPHRLPLLPALGSLPTVSTAPAASPPSAMTEGPGSPRQIPLPQTQQEHLMSINKHVMKTLLQSKSSDVSVPQTPPEKPNLGRDRQEGPMEIPRFIPFPGYPVIPPGYVPVMMSPQGFLVPMQFSQTPVKEDEKNSESQGSSTLESPQPSKVRKIAQLINSPLPEPQQLYPVGPVAPLLYFNGPVLGSKDKLAAFQLCLISQEYFSELVSKLSPKDQELLEDLYTYEKEHVAVPPEELRQQYTADLNAVNNTKTVEKPFSKRSTRVNKVTHGLERDMAEKRDLELLRLELFRDYNKQQIINDYTGRTIELYGSMCLDYTTRLSKLKKFLLQQKKLLQTENADFFNVAATDSEKLWRSALPDHVAEQPETRYLAPPKKKQKVELDQKLSDNDSYSSSASASVSGPRSSSRFKKQPKEDAKSKKRGANQVKEPVLDPMTPVTTEEQLRMITAPNSRTYEKYVIGSSEKEIADQSDIRQLAEHFKTESTLAAVIKRKEDEVRGKKKNKVLRDLIMAHDAQQAKNKPGASSPRPSTADLLSVHDSDSDMWNLNYSLSLVREYKLPLGLTQDEIDSDLAQLGL